MNLQCPWCGGVFESCVSLSYFETSGHRENVRGILAQMMEAARTSPLNPPGAEMVWQCQRCGARPPSRDHKGKPLHSAAQLDFVWHYPRAVANSQFAKGHELQDSPWLLIRVALELLQLRGSPRAEVMSRVLDVREEAFPGIAQECNHYGLIDRLTTHLAFGSEDEDQLGDRMATEIVRPDGMKIPMLQPKEDKP